jgi:endoglucanase
MKSTALASLFASGALAQGGPWSQCGGNGFSGATTCVAGYVCEYSNDWYSQCRPGPAPPDVTTLATSTRPVATTSQAPSPTPSSNPVPGKFKWFGINQSGAEFGDGIFPGREGTEFTFPSADTIRVRNPFSTSPRPPH